jgi:hypothetical protein
VGNLNAVSSERKNRWCAAQKCDSRFSACAAIRLQRRWLVDRPCAHRSKRARRSGRAADGNGRGGAAPLQPPEQLGTFVVHVDLRERHGGKDVAGGCAVRYTPATARVHRHWHLPAVRRRSGRPIGTPRRRTRSSGRPERRSPSGSSPPPVAAQRSAVLPRVNSISAQGACHREQANGETRQEESREAADGPRAPRGCPGRSTPQSSRSQRTPRRPPRAPACQGT